MSRYYKAEDIEREIVRLLQFKNESDFDFGITHGIETVERVLEDLPTIEVSEDAISRATVLEIYSDLYWMDEHLLNFKDELDKIYEKLRNAPSVIPITQTETQNSNLTFEKDTPQTETEGAEE